MIGFVKYSMVPLGVAGWLVASEPAFVRNALDIGGLITLAVGLFLSARYRALVDLQNKTGDVIVRELEAQRDRAERLEAEMAKKNAEWIQFSEEQREVRHQLKGELAEAQSRTDITGLTRLMLENNKALSEQIAQIAAAASQSTTGGV